MGNKKYLFGSGSRDAFLAWHKMLPPDLYATDVDLVLIQKTSNTTGGIVAVFDHKVIGHNKIEFTEAVLYKFFLDNGVRVFLIETGYENGLIKHPFQAREIKKVRDWKVPLFYIDPPIEFKDREEYVKWERELRETSTVDVSRQ